MRLPIVLLAGVLSLSPITHAAQADAQALPRMVATERAFAAATAEIGVRDGFLAFFADDAVQIQRGAAAVTLVPAKNALAAQPLPKLPVANQLIWEPFTGHISSDGSMGWLTGGYVLLNQAQKETVGQGAYFSVWKRQSNGTYRVWLDEGIRLPRIWQEASPFRAAPEPDPGTAGTPNEPLVEAERSVMGDATAWRARLAEGVRLHRDGMMPLAGRDSAVEWGLRQPRRTCTIVQQEIAASGDLAIVMGGCETGGATRGSYVRVWKRDATSRWRIVFQTENGV